MKSQGKFGKLRPTQALFLANVMLATASYGAAVRKVAVHEATPLYNATVCSKMSNDYDEASKSLALNNALRTGEKSQVRASQLASEDNVTITQANMTLSLMRDNHCPMPSYAASSGRYVMQASSCAVALAKQDADVSFYQLQQTMGETATRPSTALPHECDTGKWIYGKTTPVQSASSIASAPTSGEGPCPFAPILMVNAYRELGLPARPQMNKERNCTIS